MTEKLYTPEQYKEAENLICNKYYSCRERPNYFMLLVMRDMEIEKSVAKALTHDVTINNQEPMDEDYRYID